MLLLLSVCAYGQTSVAPARMKQVTECMLKVLKATPGVSGPRLGKVDHSGATVPFIEYRATETTRWVQPTRFTFIGTNKGIVLFQTILPGVMPVGSQPDLHVTDAVTKRWQLQCDVHASVLLE